MLRSGNADTLAGKRPKKKGKRCYIAMAAIQDKSFNIKQGLYFFLSDSLRVRLNLLTQYCDVCKEADEQKHLKFSAYGQVWYQFMTHLELIISKYVNLKHAGL